MTTLSWGASMLPSSLGARTRESLKLAGLPAYYKAKGSRDLGEGTDSKRGAGTSKHLLILPHQRERLLRHNW